MEQCPFVQGLKVWIPIVHGIITGMPGPLGSQMGLILKIQMLKISCCCPLIGTLVNLHLLTSWAVTSLSEVSSSQPS
jgi:hypothetical protein